jgi:hypothetical protein
MLFSDAVLRIFPSDSSEVFWLGRVVGQPGFMFICHIKKRLSQFANLRGVQPTAGLIATDPHSLAFNLFRVAGVDNVEPYALDGRVLNVFVLFAHLARFP